MTLPAFYLNPGESIMWVRPAPAGGYLVRVREPRGGESVFDIYPGQDIGREVRAFLSSQRADQRSGGYYVTIRKGSQTIMALGPFKRHRRAMGLVDCVRHAVIRANLDPWHEFGYGTARAVLRSGMTTGAFGEVLGVSPDLPRVCIGSPQRLAPAILERLA